MATVLALFLALSVGCASTPSDIDLTELNRDPEALLIVDCLLPGQVRQLGTRLTYLSPRRPIKTSASDCALRGGEYVAYDRANFATALKIWLPQAQEGDSDAQTHVGEIYEKGLGVNADYRVAAGWYRRAADQGFARAQINLGYLYETGLGVERDLTTAMNFYRDASGLTDGDLEYVSSVEFANRESAVERTEALEVEVDSLRQNLNEAEALYSAQRQSLTREQGEVEKLRSQIDAQRVVVADETRTEQERLTERLRDTELDAAEQQQRDAETIAELDRDRVATQRLLEQQARRLDQLQGLLGEATVQRDAASDQAERLRLQHEVDRRSGDLATARVEQQRLTDAFLDLQLDSKQQQSAAARQLADLEGSLDQREQLIRSQQVRLAELEGDVSRTRVQLSTRDADDVDSIVTSGPSINIIEPPLLATRGVPVLPTPANASLEVIGQIDPVESLLSLRINDQPQSPNSAGIFQFRPLASAERIRIVAVDDTGARTELDLSIDRRTSDTRVFDSATPDTPLSATITSDGASTRRSQQPEVPVGDIPFGRYHALIIGNNDYQTLTDLNTAEADARAVDRILRDTYGFETTVLLNATRYDMLAALSVLRENLTPEDNLLIYYAGHGELDPVRQRGYWLPVDAYAADTGNWVSNAAMTDLIDAMQAKHVLVVADSCYSGTLTRTSVARPPPEMNVELRRKWLRAIAGSKVRAVLSSGGVKPVYDESPDTRHSLFAREFITALESNDRVLAAYTLFFDVRQKVSAAARALNVEQDPQYAPIRHSGHEAGEFIFVPKALQQAQVTKGQEDRLASLGYRH